MPEPRFRRAVLPLGLACLIAGTIVPGPSAQLESHVSTTYMLRSSVIGAGGAPGTSTAFRSNGTLCQPTPIGIGSAGDLTLYAGFWKQLMSTVAVAERAPAPFVTGLLQNSPNPFNTATAIDYSLAVESQVELKIFDVRGNLVRILVSDTVPPGSYRTVWDARNDAGANVASGIYFYRLTTETSSFVRKMLILR